MGAIRTLRDYRAREKEILKRDAEHFEFEKKRKIASAQIASGCTINAQDAVVPPTPEQILKYEYKPYYVEKDHWTHVTVKTVRRLYKQPVKTLWQNGSISDEQYASAKWYQQQWEMGQLNPAPQISSYCPIITESTRAYGHLPRHAWQVEARRMFRDITDAIPALSLPVTQAIVLNEITISEASIFFKKRKSSIVPTLSIGLYAIQDAISSFVCFDRILST